MSSENPRWINKKTLAGLIIAFGVGFGAVVGAEKVINQDSELPSNAVEASEDFLMLQQSIMSRLEPKLYMKTPPNQLGQGFNIGEKQYTFLLDKKHEEAPNMQGYKRRLIIEKGKKGSQREEYIMYDGSVVYRKLTPSIMEPLDVDEINQLAAEVKMDFEEWHRNKGNRANS